MTDLREMLETVGLEPVIDIDELAAVLQALTDLDRDSTTCATAMMADAGRRPAAMRRSRPSRRTSARAKCGRSPSS